MPKTKKKIDNIEDTYLRDIISVLREFGSSRNVKIFLFGSSVQSNDFGDVDVGVMGDVDKRDIQRLRSFFESSTNPYIVEIVNFDEVDNDFKSKVMNSEVLWVKS
ncbi:MAG: hypothetical protein ABEI53_02315 [Candidatus Magasanikbacteria bacterium]